ncbi:hypothetical protein, partial [Enterococcus casseliflavus]|uniref:hypothetical protein n=1 Tax=Enterococcus casseliflavus TaxID=37734 RepID=UPI003D1007BB
MPPMHDARLNVLTVAARAVGAPLPHALEVAIAVLMVIGFLLAWMPWLVMTYGAVPAEIRESVR